MTRIAALAFAALAPTAAASAEPVPIPFDPPTDKPLTYLLEQIEERDGKVVTETSTDRYRFTPDGDGLVLSVSPVASTSTETDPAKIAMRAAVEKAMGNRPYSLTINQDAEISALIDGDKYWATGIAILKAELGKSATRPGNAQALENVTGMFERMSPNMRLTMMTQHIQPMVEFALTEIDPSAPITTQIETESPFGGKLRQDMVIRIDPPANGLVHVNVTSSIPRAEIERLTANFIKSFVGQGDKSKTAEIDKAIASFKEFRSDTVADYHVAGDTAVLKSYSMTRTIVASDDKGLRKRVTTMRLTLRD